MILISIIVALGVGVLGLSYRLIQLHLKEMVGVRDVRIGQLEQQDESLRRLLVALALKAKPKGTDNFRIPKATLNQVEAHDVSIGDAPNGSLLVTVTKKPVE